MVLALAVLIRLHNAGHVYKPACTHARRHMLHTCKHAPMRRVPGAAAASTPSEQGAVALEAYPATWLLVVCALAVSPCRFAHRARRCCACCGGRRRASRRTQRLVRFPVSALAHFAAVLYPRASTASEHGSSVAACTNVAASRGGLSADAACLRLNTSSQYSGLQSSRALVAHDEPFIPKQCSNASWRHGCPLLVKPVQSLDELRFRCIRHTVNPAAPPFPHFSSGRSKALSVSLRISA